MGKTHIIARAIIMDNDHMLACVGKKKNQNKRTHLFLPGGHVEHKEPIKDALIRELEEELGMKSSIVRFLGVEEYSFDSEDSSKCHLHELNFYFEVFVPGLSSAIIPKSPEDHTEFVWITPEDLEGSTFYPNGLKPILQHWLQADYEKAFRSHIVTKGK